VWPVHCAAKDCCPGSNTYGAWPRCSHAAADGDGECAVGAGAGAVVLCSVFVFVFIVLGAPVEALLGCGVVVVVGWLQVV
jgi:hypothetical protein